jgi:hypothetical protein
MSKSGCRHRVAGVAAAVLAGAPLMAGVQLVTPGTAYAGPAEAARQVVFSGGGLLGVSCAAIPNTGSVTITEETRLRVVNRTGHRATLILDGSARGEIAKGSTAEVLFHRGPVSLSLKPHCVLPNQKSVRVQVVAARPRRPDPPPPPVAEPPSPPSPPSEDPVTEQPRPDPATGSTGLGPAPRDGRGGREAAGPRGDASDGRRPAAAGGSRGAEADPTAASDGSGMEPQGLIGDETATPAAPEGALDGVDLAAEPLGSVEPITDKGPIKLLALIATVCVLGVSVGAIRAILAQRASRAGIA